MDTQFNYKPKLNLSTMDGNAFFILGTCIKIMKCCGAFTQEQIEIFKTEATSDDYDHFLETITKYFDWV